MKDIWISRKRLRLLLNIFLRGRLRSLPLGLCLRILLRGLFLRSPHLDLRILRPGPRRTRCLRPPPSSRARAAWPR